METLFGGLRRLGQLELYWAIQGYRAASGGLKDFSGFREIGQHRATLNAKGIAHLKLGSMEQIIVYVKEVRGVLDNL